MQPILEKVSSKQSQKLTESFGQHVKKGKITYLENSFGLNTLFIESPAKSDAALAESVPT